LNGAEKDKAQELVQEYVRRDPDAVMLVDDLLEGAGTSMDALVADGLAENIEDIERIRPGAAATPACARLTGIEWSWAKHRGGPCSRSRRAILQ
jgi:hypothetical protein